MFRSKTWSTATRSACRGCPSLSSRTRCPGTSRCVRLKGVSVCSCLPRGIFKYSQQDAADFKCMRFNPPSSFAFGKEMLPRNTAFTRRYCSGPSIHCTLHTAVLQWHYLCCCCCYCRFFALCCCRGCEGSPDRPSLRKEGRHERTTAFRLRHSAVCRSYRVRATYILAFILVLVH